MIKTLTLAFIMMVASSLPQSVVAADVKQGERLARQWCSNCHLIDNRQSTGGDTAPAFATIAETAADRSDDLEAWLADPHPPMPNFNLTRYEIDDLLAYINSLDAE
jgi:mono/diheme cytochrome c family protein